MASRMENPNHIPHGDVAMNDSWSNGDERRDRGRVDRGVQRSRHSRSPQSRRPEGDREGKGRDRSPRRRPLEDRIDRHRDRTPERRRHRSRSPLRDDREQVRERNRGRELLDTRGSEKKRSSTHRSTSRSRRRHSRSASPSRSHHKKSRRDRSRSPRREGGSVASSRSRGEKKHHNHSPPPPRTRSPDRKDLKSRIGETPKSSRDSRGSERRGRSPSPHRSRPEQSRVKSPRRHDSPSRRPRSQERHREKPRDRSPFEKLKDRDLRRDRSPLDKQRPSDIDRYEPTHSRNSSPPPPPRGPKPTRGGSSPKRGGRGGRPELPAREEYRPGPGRGRGDRKPFGGRPFSASGANSIEVKGTRSLPATASGANSIEVKSDKMAGRGFYQGQPGYNNPNHQMQAAFPLKPQYNQGSPQIDPRQYSQSPQHHMTPGSFHGSPVHSPHSAGRGGWVGHSPVHQPQFSPQPQYSPNYYQQQQQQYAAPTGPQAYFNNNQSPPYVPNGPMNQNYNQQAFRGNQRGGFRGNQFNNRGGRGDHRGGRGGHFQNLQWNNNGGGNLGGAGRGQPIANSHSNPQSGNVTPQHASPPQQFPAQSQPQPASQDGTPNLNSQPSKPEVEENPEDLFRPSKELRMEDKEEAKKKDEEKMPPPPARPPPTGPQSQQNPNKFSFAFKGPSKAAPTAPKPEISQKLNAAPTRNIQANLDRPRGPNSRNIPTEPASARQPIFRQPALPITRKVKKIKKRVKPRPQLEEEYRQSDSVYYRKPGNESVVGSGTYGKVFKAVHVYTKEWVALKKIRMEGERDGFPVTAVREIKLLQSLKHTNIVNLLEVMVEKNDCYMVFEYLSHDLTGLLNHPTFKLVDSHKKHLAKQLFEGLDYLHHKGVLHRDIKAANILVSNTGLLKLADFGLARFYAKRKKLDYTNRVITIWYRSPELLLGETQYGAAVDIWSAACVLIEIFTRHAIFPGDGGEISQLEKIYAILGTPSRKEWPGLVEMAWFELLRPTVRRPNVFAEKYEQRVTPEAFKLLKSMFHYDPDKRPSAEEVLKHPYFTAEEPMPKQAVELEALTGDWHEFESKALRKENEKRDKENRRLAKLAAENSLKAKTAGEKRPNSSEGVEERDKKRVATGDTQVASEGEATAPAAAPAVVDKQGDVVMAG